MNVNKEGIKPERKDKVKREREKRKHPERILTIMKTKVL